MASDEVGLGVTGSPIKGVDIRSVWEMMALKITQPNLFLPVEDVKIIDCGVYTRREMRFAAEGHPLFGHIYKEKIYHNFDGQTGEIRFVIIEDNGEESDLEHVNALNKDPATIEYYQRKRSTGERVYWNAPKAAVIDAIAKTVKMAEDVVMGVMGDPIEGADIKSVWNMMILKITQPQLYLPVKNVKTQDHGSYVGREMEFAGEGHPLLGHIYKEKIYSTFDGECGEVRFVILSDDGAETDLEHVNALYKNPARIEYYQRKRSNGERVYWGGPRAAVRQAIEKTVQMAGEVGYGTVGEPIKKEVDIDSVWKKMVLKITHPHLFLPVEDVKIIDCGVYTRREMRFAAEGHPLFGHIYKEKIYHKFDGQTGEIRFVIIDDEGEETDLEHVNALNKNPATIEYYQRKRSTGERVWWNAPRPAVVEAIAKTVSMADDVGMGVTGAPIQGVGIDAVWEKMVLKIKHPELYLPVTNVKTQDFGSYVKREMVFAGKGHPLEGHVYKEHIYDTFDGQTGEIRFVIVDDQDQETDLEHVNALNKEPATIEYYQRKRSTGERVYWAAPRGAVKDAVAKTVTMAGEIGMGIQGEARGVDLKKVWEKMVLKITKPELFLPVKDVKTKDHGSYVSREMQLALEGSPLSGRVYKEKIYSVFNGECGEIRFVILADDGKEQDLEHVNALMKNPARIEYFQRKRSNGERVYWAGPREAALGAIIKTVEMAKSS